MAVNVQHHVGSGPIATLEKGVAPYPAELLDLNDAPKILYTAGSHELLAHRRVSIVGTRSPSQYGEKVAREIGSHLARAGVCLVSGLARGIDSIVHRAALEAGGSTIAVLGTGVDVPYPASNRVLHRQIVQHGLVMSELPAGRHAFRGSFPRRNRLIAALSQVTIIVEAGRKSGALITAGHALELGRTVAAVPGQIDSPQSEGANELLRDGATHICAVADVLMLAGVDPPPKQRDLKLEPPEELVLTALAKGRQDLDSLAEKTGLPTRECVAAVSSLEINGLVECLLTGEVQRR